MKSKRSPEVENTLRLMKIISQTDEFGDCLLWNGYTNGCGHPKIFHRPARRVVWELDQGPIPGGLLITTTCGHSKCLVHLKAVTKGEVTSKAMANWATQLKKRASGARANRPGMGKITMMLAQQIRDSDETGRVWAKRLDVSVSLISKVRTGKSWVQFTGNPFAGIFRL